MAEFVCISSVGFIIVIVQCSLVWSNTIAKFLTTRVYRPVSPSAAYWPLNWSAGSISLHLALLSLWLLNDVLIQTMFMIKHYKSQNKIYLDLEHQILSYREWYTTLVVYNKRLSFVYHFQIELNRYSKDILRTHAILHHTHCLILQIEIH